MEARCKDAVGKFPHGTSARSYKISLERLTILSPDKRAIRFNQQEWEQDSGDSSATTFQRHAKATSSH